MDRDEFQRVEKVFHAAMQVDPEAREAFIEEACGGDEQLGARVRALIAGDARPSAFRPLLASSRGVEPPPLAPELPSSIGEHEILEEIDRGGMGVVYRARQPRLDRDVALKVILSGRLASLGELARFDREARATASLEHRNIVPVYEVGEAGGLHYLSMKLLERGTLARPKIALDQSPHGAAGLVEKISRAVHYAHERGVLHRDLKPANVLLDENAEPLVTDFGLAVFADRASSITRTGETLGTPAYMAPEQAAGKRAEISTATDVYSLGAILYELVTGRPPFDGETSHETLRQVIEDPPSAPRLWNPKVPRDLETICLKCLEKDAGRRYPSAAALADDLGRFQRHQPIVARPLGRGARALRWCRRHPASVAIWALLLLTSGAGLFWRSERNAALENLRSSYLLQTRAQRVGAEPGRHFQGLETLERAAALRPGVDVRNEVIACLAVSDIQPRASWPGYPEGSTVIAFDPDYRRYARGDQSGVISVRDVAGDKETSRLQGPSKPVMRILFRAGGRSLAATFGVEHEPADIRVWDVESGENVLALPEAVRSGSFDLSDDGARLVVFSPENELQVRVVPTGRSVADLATKGKLREPLFSPDGRRLALLRENSTVEIVDAGLESDRLELDHAPEVVTAVGWHPGGRRIAVGDWKGEVRVWNTESGEPDRRFRAHETHVIRCAFVNDSLLASVGWDNYLSLWDVTVGEKVISAYTVVARTHLRVSRDGTTLGFTVSPPDVWTWRLYQGSAYRGQPGTAYSRQPGLEFVDPCVALSPDERVLAAGGEDGANVVDLESDGSVRLPLARVASVVFVGDSSDLLTSGEDGVVFWRLVDSTSADEPGFSVRRLKRLDLPDGAVCHRACVSADGLRLAVIVEKDSKRRISVFDLDSDGPVRQLAHDRAWWVASSIDGAWLASSPFNGTATRVWDVATGDVVASFPGCCGTVRFSPQDRWLAVSTEKRLVLARVGTWETHLEIPRRMNVGGPVVFTADGNVLMAGYPQRHIRILDALTGMELATLESQDRAMVQGLAVTGNAEFLAVVTARRGVRIWDFVLIRAKLRAMGLDWE